MQTKEITCPRCDGRGELIRSMARLPSGERCNVCFGKGSIKIVVDEEQRRMSDDVRDAGARTVAECTCPHCVEVAASTEPMNRTERIDAALTSPVTEMRPIGLTFDPKAEHAGLSWNGFNVFGDRKSMEHVRDLINKAHYRDYFQTLLIKDRNELARMRATCTCGA